MRQTPITTAIAALILAAAHAAPAMAQSAPLPCKPPKIPVSKAFKPYQPTCITRDAATNTFHCTCDRAQCNRFKSELDDYHAGIGAYVQALNKYVEDAAKYAQCKVEEINRENAG